MFRKPANLLFHSIVLLACIAIVISFIRDTLTRPDSEGTSTRPTRTATESPSKPKRTDGPLKLAAVARQPMKYGVLDSSGNTVIKPKWDRLENLGNGYFYGGLDDSFHVFDSDGRDLLVMKTDTLYRLGDNSAVTVRIGSHYSLFDIDTGRFTETLPPAQDFSFPPAMLHGAQVAAFDAKDDPLPHLFFDGYALARNIEGYFFIDESGKRAFGPFADAQPFSEGLAAVQSQSDGQWHYIDTAGKAATGKFNGLVWPFHNGNAFVQRSGENNLVIDKTGKTVLELPKSDNGNGSKWAWAISPEKVVLYFEDDKQQNFELIDIASQEREDFAIGEHSFPLWPRKTREVLARGEFYPPVVAGTMLAAAEQAKPVLCDSFVGVRNWNDEFAFVDLTPEPEKDEEGNVVRKFPPLWQFVAPDGSTFELPEGYEPYGTTNVKGAVLAHKDMRFTLFDTQGERLVDSHWRFVSYFENGEAIVLEGLAYRIASLDGGTDTKAVYRELRRMKDGYRVFMPYETCEVVNVLTGEVLDEYIGLVSRFFGDRYAKLTDGHFELEGVFDKDISSPLLYDIGQITRDKFIIRSFSGEGLMNRNGKVIIEPVFDSISSTGAGLFSCTKGKEQITLNSEGMSAEQWVKNALEKNPTGKKLYYSGGGPESVDFVSTDIASFRRDGYFGAVLMDGTVLPARYAEVDSVAGTDHSVVVARKWVRDTAIVSSVRPGGEVLFTQEQEKLARMTACRKENGYIGITRNGTLTVFTKDGKFVIEGNFGSFFHNLGPGLIALNNDTRLVVIEDGEIIADRKNLNSVRYAWRGVFSHIVDGKWQLVDKSGRDVTGPGGEPLSFDLAPTQVAPDRYLVGDKLVDGSGKVYEVFEGDVESEIGGVLLIKRPDRPWRLYAVDGSLDMTFEKKPSFYGKVFGAARGGRGYVNVLGDETYPAQRVSVRAAIRKRPAPGQPEPRRNFLWASDTDGRILRVSYYLREDDKNPHLTGIMTQKGEWLIPPCFGISEIRVLGD
ncbi:MAG: WG repeat-containing protein [Planctomycetota bacterium]|nr:WG repeat-containing protein [Planctomycetota bacterium]